MTEEAPTFLDSNIFVYAVDTSDPAKQQRAQEVIASTEATYVISSQVMSEFYTVTTRKLTPAVTLQEAEDAVEAMSRMKVIPVDATLVLRGVRNSQALQLSYWDGLIIAAAQLAGCQRVLTEDLADGATLGGIRIENPFT